MTFATPLFLLALIPLAIVAFLLWRQAPMLVPALPGGWARLIQPELRGFMARDLARPGLGQVWLCLAVAAIMIVGAARPLIPLGQSTDYANLIGRVIVLDADRPGIEERRIIVDQLLLAAPDAPTALALVAGDAYLVTPFTTDIAQIDRYLRVAEPDAMPAPGLAVHSALALAERVIADARIVAAQIVLVAGADAPAQMAKIPETDTLRAFVIAGDPAAWQSGSAQYGADLHAADDLEPVTAALGAAIEDLRADLPGAVIDISPWVFGLAMVLSLGLFRQRSAL